MNLNLRVVLFQIPVRAYKNTNYTNILKVDILDCGLLVSNSISENDRAK